MRTSLLEKVFEDGQVLSYRKGEIIVDTNQDPDGVYLILEGFVKSTTVTKYNEESLLAIRSQNEIFPIIWIFTDDNSQAGYTAITPTRIAKTSRQDFLDALGKDSRLQKEFSELMINAYRLQSERVRALTYRTVRERVCSYLMSLSRHYGQQQADQSILIEVPTTRNDIAAAISSTRETVSRELSALHKRGILSRNDDSQIVIFQPDQLSKIAA